VSLLQGRLIVSASPVVTTARVVFPFDTSAAGAVERPAFPALSQLFEKCNEDFLAKLGPDTGRENEAACALFVIARRWKRRSNPESGRQNWIASAANAASR